MNQQKASSIHFQDEIFCMTCLPTVAAYGETSACGQLPFL
uniref:Uncharacterized protein n=1 Tax=Lotus japonicus TaxID=34305 RepID=I3SW56_LOTJA|nr:unknown [Lotus japonicus]